MFSEAIEKIKREMRQEWFYNNGLYEICESPEKAINEIVFRVLEEAAQQHANLVEQQIEACTGPTGGWLVSPAAFHQRTVPGILLDRLSGVAQEEKDASQT